MTQQNCMAKGIVAAAVVSLCLVVLIPANELQAAVATTHIAITKVASLVVEKMDTDHLYQFEGEERMTSTTCLRAGGESIVYRVSAASLASANTFAVKSRRTDKEIPYQVVWTDAKGSYALNTSRDTSNVLQTTVSDECEPNSLSVVFDQQQYLNAPNGRYFDTLSLIFVIE